MYNFINVTIVRMILAAVQMSLSISVDLSIVEK